MESLPGPIGHFLQQWIQQRFTFAYILVDEEGVVRSWGGDLQHLGLPALEAGEPIGEKLLFTEGLFPVQVESLYLPMVKIDPHRSLDVHLFRTTNGYGLFLVDATEKDHTIARWQQKANELALEAEMTTRIAGSTVDLYQALDIAAMRLDADGTFVLIGQPPDWLEQFCPITRDGHTSCLTLDGTLAFLENFLIEARDFWQRGRVGCCKSGLWIETDESGKEHFLEAIAVTTAHERILLITRDLSYFDEKLRIIQAGRQIASEKDALRSRQQELVAMHKALEDRVRRRTNQLQEANARLAGELAWRRQIEQERTEIMHQLQQAQKMEAIGTLAGGIAHDFNNILSAILGFTELSLKEAGDNNMLRANLHHILHASDRARDLIRQILTFSRQSKPESRPVRPQAIIREALKLMRASLPASVEIEQELTSDAYILADPTQLHQVIINLCTNAAQAMQDSGGLLLVRLADLTLQPENMARYPELQPGAYVELTVRDSGQGMTEEILPRIFDPFFTTKEEGKGTGMGLAVVHGIVKSCHGAIFVSSQPGIGSVFRVLLPIIQAAEPAEPSPASTVGGGSECILYIDDEPLQVELARQMLGSLGYDVVATTDSLQAISRFAEDSEKFDLVISDLNMPGMNGWALTRKLRQLRPDIPIILCSGYHDDLYQGRLSDLQVQGYLPKPVSMMEMARTIRRVLDS